MKYINYLLHALSSVLFLYPLTILIYGIINSICLYNWVMPCGYNHISFQLFMFCLFLITFYMMLLEQDKLVVRAVFGSIVLFALFHIHVFNIMLWVVTVVFSAVLILYIFRTFGNRGF